MEFSVGNFLDYFKQVVVLMEENKDYLCELDRKLGDGDHGVTMSIGFQAVQEQLEGPLADETDCGILSTKVGMTFLNAVGSSVGPLYATGFMRGGKAVKGKSNLTDDDLYEYWTAYINGVKERGNAKIGDKTMMDTLLPTLETLESSYTEDFIDTFEQAVMAGEKGMKSTKDLISQVGRSSRLGERSKGYQDPGATSAYLMLKEFLACIKKAA